MLTKITGKGMEIYHPDGYSVVLSDWSVKLNILNTLIQFPTFEAIDINNFTIHMLSPDEDISDSLKILLPSKPAGKLVWTVNLVLLAIFVTFEVVVLDPM